MTAAGYRVAPARLDTAAGEYGSRAEALSSAQSAVAGQSSIPAQMAKFPARGDEPRFHAPPAQLIRRDVELGADGLGDAHRLRHSVAR